MGIFLSKMVQEQDVAATGIHGTLPVHNPLSQIYRITK